MLRSTQLRKSLIVNLAPFTASTLLILSQAHFSVARAAAPPEGSEQQESTAEVSIEAERQSALAKQAMTISETPDAGPQSKHRSVVLGLGAILGPDYLGSKTDKVGAIPVIDVRGLWGGRVYISDLNGLGLNLVDVDSFRAGLNLGPATGRKSSVDPHLKGLPDVGDATAIGGFMAYWRGPLAFQANIAQRVGPRPGTAATLGAAYSVAPLPNLQLNFSTSLTWADARLQNTFFGISPTAAARTASVGNPLPSYTPGAGAVNVAGTATAVYLLGEHWGVVTRVGLVELVGHSVRDSPLTQRAFQPNVAFGVLYVF